MKRLSELKDKMPIATGDPVAVPESALDISDQIQAQLEGLKTDLIDHQALQKQITELREEKATALEQHNSQGRRIGEMGEQLEKATATEKSLQETIAELTEHINSVSALPDTGDLDKVKGELIEAQAKVLAAEEFAASSQAEINELKESAVAKDEEIAALRRREQESEQQVTSVYIPMV